MKKPFFWEKAKKDLIKKDKKLGRIIMNYPKDFLFSKSDVIGEVGLEKFVFFWINVFCDLFSAGLAPLEEFALDPNLGDLFSITTVFFD